MGKIKIRPKHYGATKHCVFGDCVSDNRFDYPGYDPHLRFYRFPKPCLEIRREDINDPQTRCKHLQTCKYCEGVAMWVQCCKSKTVTSIAKITTNTYICDKHFIKKYGSIKEINHCLVVPQSTVVINKMRENSIIEVTGMENHLSQPQEQLEDLQKIHQVERQSQERTKDVMCQTDVTGEQLDALLLEINKLTLAKETCTETHMKQKNSREMDRFESKLKSNDKMCQFYTGMVYSTIKAILAFLCIIENETPIKYWGQQVHQVKRKPKQWSFIQEVILTLVRLRSGLLVEDLAYRFGVSHAFVCRLVNTWIHIMYHKFNSVRPYMFPSRDVIKEHLPASFAKFKNIRVIIDATEIFCQVPQDYQQQGNLYSQYKSHTTFKVLIGCTPNGAVSFVSDLFEGSISDRELVIQSKLMDLLDEKDLVLADRGFTIKDLMDEKNCKLNIPAFLKGRERLTAQEEVETKIIAKERIYVEHVMGRLKQFRLLKKIIPLSMRGTISQMVFVCACLLNFQEPYIT